MDFWAEWTNSAVEYFFYFLPIIWMIYFMKLFLSLLLEMLNGVLHSQSVSVYFSHLFCLVSVHREWKCIMWQWIMQKIKFASKLNAFKRNPYILVSSMHFSYSLCSQDCQEFNSTFITFQYSLSWVLHRKFA